MVETDGALVFGGTLPKITPKNAEPGAERSEAEPVDYAARGSRATTITDTPPPLLGEHTGQILSELGYSAQEIEELRQAKAI